MNVKRCVRTATRIRKTINGNENGATARLARCIPLQSMTMTMNELNELNDPTDAHIDVASKDHPEPDHTLQPHAVMVPSAANARLGWLVCAQCEMIVGQPWWVVVNGNRFVGLSGSG